MMKAGSEMRVSENRGVIREAVDHRHESEQDYLEAVLRITKEKGECHSVDVARQLGVSKPSVSVAVAKLEEKGLLVMDAQKLLQLTPKGDAIARRIFERHMFFKNHLIGIGVDEDTAEYEACLLEHDISQQTFEKMKQALTH